MVPLEDNIPLEYEVLIKKGTLSWGGGKPQGAMEKKNNQDKQLDEYVTEDRRR